MGEAGSAGKNPSCGWVAQTEEVLTLLAMSNDFLYDLMVKHANSVIEATKRTNVPRKVMFHGTASGPNGSVLRSILKQGLIPGLKKAWDKDPEALSNKHHSRASYDGIYFSDSVSLGLSSARFAAKRDDSQYPVIISAEIQPRSALPDEDDYGFVESAFNKVTRGSESAIALLYLAARFPNQSGRLDAMLEGAENVFHEHIVARLDVAKARSDKQDLKPLTDKLLGTEVDFHVSHMDSGGSFMSYDAMVLDRAKDYLDKFDPKSLPQPEIDDAELAYRKALDDLMRATKKYAMGDSEYKRFRHTLRVTEPITFGGRNRVKAIVSLPNYQKREIGKDPLILVLHYGDPAEILEQLEREQFRPGIQVVRPDGQPINDKEGAEAVSAAAYTDETGKFWGSQGAGAVFYAEDTGRILIQHRSKYVNEPSTWGVIGGAIDAGEDPEEAMIREVREETDYHGPMKAELIYTFQSGKFQYHNFLVTVPEEFEPHHGWESQGHVWTTLDDLPEPLHFGFKALLPALEKRLGKATEP